MAKILLIEDDADLTEVLRFTLSNKGHSVKSAERRQRCAAYVARVQIRLDNP